MAVRDVILALATFVLFTGPILTGTTDGQGPVWAIAVFGLLTSAPLALRRSRPRAVLTVVSLGLIAAAFAEVRFTPWVSNAGPALGIAVFTVAERYPRRISAQFAAIAIAGVTASELIAYGLHPDAEQNAVYLVVGPVGWVLGQAWRKQLGLDEELRAERAGRRAEAERRIRAEERLRVAADVHDIVSHALGLIAVRSGVARVVLEQRPDEAKAALTAIENASRTALDELRGVLRAIRDPETLGESGLHRRTVADVRPLVDQMRQDGLPVILRQPGNLGVPPLVGESAYRIVQEALTNVRRHAGNPRTEVVLEKSEGSLRISVINGRGNLTPVGRSGGFGLTGMRQRVELHGGTLRAEPTPEGGFAVVASLPDPSHE